MQVTRCLRACSHLADLGDAIHVGALYDPDLLPDHKGDFFKHVHAKLVQRDIRDCKGDLIPPWEMYSKLRQCTMVLVRATLYCWVIRNKEGSGVKKVTNLASDYAGKDSELITSSDLSRYGKKHSGSRWKWPRLQNPTRTYPSSGQIYQCTVIHFHSEEECRGLWLIRDFTLA